MKCDKQSIEANKMRHVHWGKNKKTKWKDNKWSTKEHWGKSVEEFDKEENFSASSKFSFQWTSVKLTSNYN